MQMIKHFLEHANIPTFDPSDATLSSGEQALARIVAVVRAEWDKLDPEQQRSLVDALDASTHQSEQAVQMLRRAVSKKKGDDVTVTDLASQADRYVADNPMLVEQYCTISQIQRYIDDTAMQTAHHEQMAAEHGHTFETDGLDNDELVDAELVEKRDEMQRLFDAHACVFVQNVNADGVEATEYDGRRLLEQACSRPSPRW